MAGKRILSVGQCSADHGSLTRTFQQHFSAEVVPAHSIEDGLTRLRAGAFDLVLVNRVLDANGDPGMDLIQQMKSEPTLASIPVMLVSNYESSQDEAVQAGAVRGFGKSALGQPAMLECVSPYLRS